MGKDKNKVIVYFFGGGVSITPKTSEGGKEFYATNMMAQDFGVVNKLSNIVNLLNKEK